MWFRLKYIFIYLLKIVLGMKFTNQIQTVDKSFLLVVNVYLYPVFNLFSRLYVPYSIAGNQSGLYQSSVQKANRRTIVLGHFKLQSENIQQLKNQTLLFAKDFIRVSCSLRHSVPLWSKYLFSSLTPIHNLSYWLWKCIIFYITSTMAPSWRCSCFLLSVCFTRL